MTRRKRLAVRQFATRMRLGTLPLEHRKGHIGPGSRALYEFIGPGYIQSKDLTSSELQDMHRRAALIDKQADEEIMAAVLATIEMMAKSDIKTVEVRIPAQQKRKRGRPKGKPLLEKDRSIVREMVVAHHLAHLGVSSGEASDLTATSDVSNLLQQASQKAFQEASTTTNESIRHRIVSRFRKGEINASDFGLASLHFDKFARAIQSLARGFAQKTVRRKNRS